MSHHIKKCNLKGIDFHSCCPFILILNECACVSEPNCPISSKSGIDITSLGATHTQLV
jgi:hypothetical protein